MFYLGLAASIVRPEAKCLKPIVRPAEPRFSPEATRDAIVKHQGNLASAAAELGTPRWVLWEFVQRCPDLLALVTQARQATYTLAENHLRTALEKKQAWAIDCILSTFGTKSGPLSPAQAELLQLARQAQAERQATTVKSPRRSGSDDGPRRKGSDDKELGIESQPAEFIAKQWKLQALRRTDDLRRNPHFLASSVATARNWISEIENGLRLRIDYQFPCAIKFALTDLGRMRGYRQPPAKDKPETRPTKTDKPEMCPTKTDKPGMCPTKIHQSLVGHVSDVSAKPQGPPIDPNKSETCPGKTHKSETCPTKRAFPNTPTRVSQDRAERDRLGADAMRNRTPHAAAR